MTDMTGAVQHKMVIVARLLLGEPLKWRGEEMGAHTEAERRREGEFEQLGKEGAAAADDLGIGLRILLAHACFR